MASTAVSGDRLKINLGSGADPRPGWIDVDIDPLQNPDVAWDLNVRPYPFEDGSAEHIYAAQVLEHLSLHSIDFFKETYRILATDGTLELVLPNMFSLRNRFRYLIGRSEASPEWNPYHTKLVHPRYLVQLARHIGFDARLRYGRASTLPRRDLFADYIWLVARKRR